MDWACFSTEVGDGFVGFDGDRVLATVLPGGEPPGPTLTEPPASIRRLVDGLVAYFDGRRPLPEIGAETIAVTAATPLRRAIYRRVIEIPAGSTMTYQEIAEAVGRPGAARAVGAAMAANRLAPLIPCHRVVGSDGRLRGYAGGLDMKRRLLEMEAGNA